MEGTWHGDSFPAPQPAKLVYTLLSVGAQQVDEAPHQVPLHTAQLEEGEHHNLLVAEEDIGPAETPATISILTKQLT